MGYSARRVKEDTAAFKILIEQITTEATGKLLDTLAMKRSALRKSIGAYAELNQAAHGSRTTYARAMLGITSVSSNSPPAE